MLLFILFFSALIMCRVLFLPMNKVTNQTTLLLHVICQPIINLSNHGTPFMILMVWVTSEVHYYTATNLFVFSSVISERSEAPDSSNCSVATVNDEPDQTSQKIENCSQNTFRSVAELSLGSEALSGPGIINMVIFIGCFPL